MEIFQKNFKKKKIEKILSRIFQLRSAVNINIIVRLRNKSNKMLKQKLKTYYLNYFKK